MEAVMRRDADLKSVGSSVLYDTIFLFMFPPAGLFALTANLLSYHIFSSRYFKQKPLYTYLRASCLNSSVVNFIMAISFICDSRRFLQISNSEFATYFRCYLKIPIVNTCHFYGSVLDIVLAVDRLAEFTRFKPKFRQLNPVKLSLGLFIICVAINSTYVLIFEPKKRAFQSVESNRTEYFYFYGESSFALSLEGVIFKNILYLVRDVLTLLLLVLINITSLILFRREFKLEKINHQSTVTPPDLSKYAPQISCKKSNSAENSAANNSLLLTQKSSQRSSIDILQESINRRNLYSNVVQVRAMLTKMVFIICAFASFQHLFLTLSLQMFTNVHRIKLHMIFMTNVFILLRHSINFWIFYYFNSCFRKRFRNFVLRKNKN